MGTIHDQILRKPAPPFVTFKTVIITIFILSTGTSAFKSISPIFVKSKISNGTSDTSYLEGSDSPISANTTSTTSSYINTIIPDDNGNDNNVMSASTTSRTAFRVTSAFSTNMNNEKWKDQRHLQNRQNSDKLPLEKLFPQIITPNNTATATATADDPNRSDENGNEKRNETESELNTKLSSRLLNHSILHGSDDELDRLVFSQLPEGSKLVLRTVKIVKTDENGNEEMLGDPAVTWDVVPINSTVGEEADEELFEYDEEGAEDGDESANEPDLDQAGSHPKTAASEYSTYGENQKKKTKTNKYNHGQDHGKEHKLTNTDTEGKKVTNYKGTEKGLNDFAKSHGNSQSNEGERYKNSKKKNKGRKVTGFKRVYHKEEFQRTEHFYDDEEAKKIAESYGLSDAIEKSKHGEKKDDQKYHGTRVEKTDGEKVKNEHLTKNGHHKGQQTAYKDSEEQKHNQNYRTAKHQNYRTQYPQQQGYQHQNQQQQHQNYYPQHSYQGAYSQQRPTPHVGIRTRGQDIRPHNVRSVALLSVVAPKEVGMEANEEAAISSPETSDIPLTMPTGSDESEFDPIRAMLPPAPPPTQQQRHEGPVFAPKPAEMKIFFAERERRIPRMPVKILQNVHYYAPNFGPEASEGENIEGMNIPLELVGGNNEISQFYSKMGPSNSSDAHPRQVKPYQNQNYNHDRDRDRYADKYSTTSPTLPPPMFDAIPEYYSTILKMSAKPGLVTFVNYKPNANSNLISIEKIPAKVLEPVIETVPQYSRPESIFFANRYTNWAPVESGTSNTENSIQPSGNNTSLESTEIIAAADGDRTNSTEDSSKDVNSISNPKYKTETEGLIPGSGIEDEKYIKYLENLAVIGRPRPQSQLHPGRRRPQGLGFPFRQSPGPVPLMRGKGHYYGRTIGPNSNIHVPGGRPPNFMGGLMNSVSEFFNRIGK